MGLKAFRSQLHLTQRELSRMSGINFRSLQDYEQGHKKLASASGDILLRLSTVLGCSTEALLTPDVFFGAPLLSANQMTAAEIQGQPFFCERYQTFGRWICSDSGVATFFYYDGKPYMLPFSAIFSRETLPWLKEAASMQIESKIEELQFSQCEKEW